MRSDQNMGVDFLVEKRLILSLCVEVGALVRMRAWELGAEGKKGMHQRLISQVS